MVSVPEDDPLGVFLRSRRERLAPSDLGIPGGGRRRTPGLRREEVAMLAGISVDYLVRLEQGRDRSPSASVLAALSDALRLDADERRHVLTLVARSTQPEMCPSPLPPSPLSAHSLALLERLEPTPAFIAEPSGDVVSWNRAYRRLMDAAGLFDREPPNLLRHTFLHPASRSLYRDWGAVAREQVAGLRAAATRCTVGRSLDGLIGELSVASAEFARLWAQHEVHERRRGVDRVVHPVAGPMDLAFEVLLLPDRGDRRLTTYLPADGASAIALEHVLGARDGRVGALRLVEGSAPRAAG
jgi:transcriptional regulator with XRE-family HTH domain